jgi:hypothetical protein
MDYWALARDLLVGKRNHRPSSPGPLISPLPQADINWRSGSARRAAHPVRHPLGQEIGNPLGLRMRDSSSSALASCRTGVSKPSVVDQP